MNRRDRWDGGGPVPLAQSLRALSDRMGLAPPDVLRVVFSRWEEVVGPTMSVHVRPVRLEETTLVVVADHPAWATQVRHLASEVLARLGDACGSEHAPDHLEVLVRA